MIGDAHDSSNRHRYRRGRLFAAAVLAGLLANVMWGWWWLDPVVALGIAGLAVWEGIESWRGDPCC